MDHVFQREDDAARLHQNNGVARVNGVSWDTQFLSHPRIGGSRGYNIPLRQMMVDSYQAGNPAPEGMLRSIQRWMKKSVVPLRMMGNKPSSALSGRYLLLLVMFKLIWLQANYCKCISFIANESDDTRLISEEDVGKALWVLGYTMKVTSTVRIRCLLSVIWIPVNYIGPGLGRLGFMGSHGVS
jgi:hypothetical protein